MAQFVSQLESKTFPPSFPFAFFFEDLQESLKAFTLDIKEEVKNFRVVVSELLDGEARKMREDIQLVLRGVNHKMDEIIENEQRQELRLEELGNIESTQEESTISKNESISGLEEENLQVYSRFFIKDTSFNHEWKLEEAGNEIEKFLKETKISRRRKDFAFLFEELKCRQEFRIYGIGREMEKFLKEMKTSKRRKDFFFLFHESKCLQASRGDTSFEIPAIYSGFCYRLITALQVKDFFQFEGWVLISILGCSFGIVG